MAEGEEEQAFQPSDQVLEKLKDLDQVMDYIKLFRGDRTIQESERLIEGINRIVRVGYPVKTQVRMIKSTLTGWLPSPRAPPASARASH